MKASMNYVMPALNFIEPVVIADASDSISEIYLLRHKVNR